MPEHPARRLANLERELAEIGEQFQDKNHRKSIRKICKSLRKILDP